MPATDLQQAAGQSYDNMSAQWILNQLKSHLVAFVNDLLPIFPDSDANSRPIANWLTIMAADGMAMAASGVPITDLSTVAQHLYKMLWLCSILEGQGLVVPPAPFAVLTAFNTHFPGT